MILSKQQKAGFFLLAIITLCGSALAFWPTETSQTPYQAAGAFSRESIEAERTWWRDALERSDAQLVYEDFKETYTDLDLKKQHTLAHIFGEALYEAVSLNGIKVCDKAYSSGCFHSFFTQAVRERGLEVIAELDAVCLTFEKRFSSCQHGIGHALQAATGYATDDLLEALQFCDTLSHPHLLFGCESGVFMEFNMRTMSEAGVRPLDMEELYYPCDVIPHEYQNNCYYEFTQWLLPSTSYDYQKAAEYCSEIEKGTNRRSCFYGLGVILGGINPENVSFIHQTCDSLEAFGEKNTCLYGASVSQRSAPRGQEFREAVCKGFKEPSAVDLCIDMEIIDELISGDFLNYRI